MSNAQRTPHAAIIIWNYDNRISADGAPQSTVKLDAAKTIISTVSCISIDTNKNKAEPAGQFQIVLAPTKNWLSVLTSGSWCAILMSNEPITEDIVTKQADSKFVKMIGRIETVRCEVTVGPDGQKQTRYLVAGTDWGYFFHNVLYIDNYISAANEKQSLSSDISIQILRGLVSDKENTLSTTRTNLQRIINYLGKPLSSDEQSDIDYLKKINRLAKTHYDLRIPPNMAKYFHFNSTTITKILRLTTGRLVRDGEYKPIDESYGILNPLTLQGTNTLWSILVEQSNTVLNELFSEIDWTNGRPQLTLYNRIKPFSYRKNTANKTSNFASGGASATTKLRSSFKYVKSHLIDPLTVLTVNAGTNWRDKYNFIEIKPNWPDFQTMEGIQKVRSQDRDVFAFNREGFRPLILETKHFPKNFDMNVFSSWVELQREWFFDTHRLLNGSITLTGSTEYIAVGNNILFDAKLLNNTPNINQKVYEKKPTSFYILAHIESVSHSFRVIPETGARTFITTINFVRGIVVDDKKQIIGSGSLDELSDKITPLAARNSVNINATSSSDDPDPQKLKGGT